jgi:hypothetical protein
MFFENAVLRKLHGPKRAEVIEKRTKLHHDEADEFYSSPNIIR